jgi:hypothetical protein
MPKMALLAGTVTPLRLVNSTASAEVKSKKKAGDSSHSARPSEDASSRPGTTRGASSVSNVSSADTNDTAPKIRRGLSKMLLSSKNNSKSNVSSAQPTTQKSPVPSMTPSSKTTEESGADAEDDASIAGSFKTTKSTNEPRRVTFLTEQVSHHPPISSFFVECKEAGVELYGVDQLSAKFTGTSA